MRKSSPSLSERVLRRLTQAEESEPNPHLRDDYRIASIAVVNAARGHQFPLALATYAVIGLHPDKVWPAIQARRKAQLAKEYSAWYDENGNLRAEWNAPPKKPAQAVSLWCEQNIGARAANSRAGDEAVLREPTTPVPMATASIAALYRNSDASSSAKTRRFTYEEMLAIVEFSGAPHSIRQGTLSALKARGRWPNEDGPATGVVCISLLGMMLHGVCCRSTARWRARRAVKLGYWRQLRDPNSWSKCPKCAAERAIGTCEKCGYVGRAKTPEGKANFDEFCRPYMYEIDIEKFRSAPRCRELRHFNARTYAEYKEAAKRGEHANVTEMPARKSPQPTPDPPPAPAAPVRQPAAEHAHRNPARPRTVVHTEISERARKAAELLFEMCALADFGAMEQIAISIVAEGKRQGIEIEDAAKFIAERAIEDQKRNIPLTRFYFRDLKWRTGNEGQGRQTSAQGRADRSKQCILEALAESNRGPGAFNDPELEE